ncbi:MAG: putative rane protein [Sedimentibacter sp.]|nr:putative rane protein [Sedimentibacter sp.]
MQEKLLLNKKKCKGEDKVMSMRTVVSFFIILVLIPTTIWFGIKFLNDRKYYFISLMILIYVSVPFFMVFENREPQARELIIISVLASTAVIGRTIFFMIPAFKPMIAIVIIAGVTFGAESGFLTGAVAAFASNFIFGQGPWTPWQMFSLGLIGFIAGILSSVGLLKKKKIYLCIFGCITTYLIYGVIMNFASVVMYSNNVTKSMVLAAFVSGIPYDTVHAFSTVFFMYFLSDSMIEKLDRIRLKYGMIR